MQKRKKLIVSIVALFAMITSMSYAGFTDRAAKAASGEAEKFCLSLDEVSYEGEELKPGEEAEIVMTFRDLEYSRFGPRRDDLELRTKYIVEYQYDIPEVLNLNYGEVEDGMTIGRLTSDKGADIEIKHQNNGSYEYIGTHSQEVDSGLLKDGEVHKEVVKLSIDEDAHPVAQNARIDVYVVVQAKLGTSDWEEVGRAGIAYTDSENEYKVVESNRCRDYYDEDEEGSDSDSVEVFYIMYDLRDIKMDRDELNEKLNTLGLEVSPSGYLTYKKELDSKGGYVVNYISLLDENGKDIYRERVYDNMYVRPEGITPYYITLYPLRDVEGRYYPYEDEVYAIQIERIRKDDNGNVIAKMETMFDGRVSEEAKAHVEKAALYKEYYSNIPVVMKVNDNDIVVYD